MVVSFIEIAPDAAEQRLVVGGPSDGLGVIPPVVTAADHLQGLDMHLALGVRTAQMKMGRNMIVAEYVEGHVAEALDGRHRPRTSRSTKQDSACYALSCNPHHQAALDALSRPRFFRRASVVGRRPRKAV